MVPTGTFGLLWITGHFTKILFEDVLNCDFRTIHDLLRELKEPFDEKLLDVSSFTDAFDEVSMASSWKVPHDLERLIVSGFNFLTFITEEIPNLTS